MNSGRTVFSQLIQHLPEKEFQKCVARHHGDSDQREVYDFAGIVSIKRPVEKRLVSGKGYGVDSDAEGEGKHGYASEAGGLAQHAEGVLNVLRERFGEGTEGTVAEILKDKSIEQGTIIFLAPNDLATLLSGETFVASVEAV